MEAERPVWGHYKSWKGLYQSIDRGTDKNHSEKRGWAVLLRVSDRGLGMITYCFLGQLEPWTDKYSASTTPQEKSQWPLHGV